MKLSDFNYNLPQELIAQHPLTKRDHSRLMVIDRQSGLIEHSRFDKLNEFLPANTRFVINNSKVIPARIYAYRNSGAKIEIFLLKETDISGTYEVFMRPMSRVKSGEILKIEDSPIQVVIVDRERRLVRFNHCQNIMDELQTIGHVPLPPYIKREDQVLDHSSYQTVYAKEPGSVASPTAGLHFTNELLERLAQAGHVRIDVTLHVNQGTFKPVEVEDITQHAMHSEDYEVQEESFNLIQEAKKNQYPILAVGTTSCRVLETIAKDDKRCGKTDIFIYPGYSFQSMDMLVTNFHLPQSSLLMLVYAFGSPNLMKKAYIEAIDNQYRFYSYGDAMLIK